MDNKLIQSGQSLTLKQEQFCIEFIKDFNATAAAVRAGYSEKTAYSIGSENRRKPLISSKIEELMKAATMQPEEIKKRLTDISRDDLSEYIIARTIPYTPKVKVGLQVVIDNLRANIDFEDDYALQVNFNAKELIKHEKGQEGRRRLMIRYKLELQNNPNAYRVIDGETEMIETPELDIIKISRDKEKGKIKSFKMTKEGPQVELYAADAALTSLARVYAMFIDKQQVDITTKLEGMTEAQLEKLTDLLISLDGKPQHLIDDAINLMITHISEDGTTTYR